MTPRPNGDPPVAELGETFDLDAARAARTERLGPPPGIVVGGARYPIPRTVTLDLFEIPGIEFDEEKGQVRASPRQLGELLRGLIGQSAYDAVRASGPTDVDDLEELIGGVLKAYGLTLGESQASADSSGDTSPPSRRTSPGSTGSNSPARSGPNRATKRAAAKRSR